MSKLLAKIAIYCAFIHFLLAGKVSSRHLKYNAAEFVSDGRDDESILRLKGEDYSEEACELMYGFLPCSTNVPSHIFLIVIYEFLLYHAESYAGGDGLVVFQVVGNKFVVSVISQLLDALPDSLILLATGLSSSREKAQDYAVTGAGLLAGSSILLLTLLWGLCLICGTRKFYVQPDSEVEDQAIKILKGRGVHTDADTSFHAQVMFFSLIPFVIIILPSVFGLSYSSQEYTIVLLVSLFASVICLISYFGYQYHDSRIWERRLEYAEVEQKIEMHVPFYEVQALTLDMEKQMEKRLKILESNQETVEQWLKATRDELDKQYSTKAAYNQVVELLQKDKNNLIDQMMKRASRKALLKEDGAPDESAIDRFFELINTDHDEYITRDELKDYIMKVNDVEIPKDDRILDIIMRHLDSDENGNIDRMEFRSGVVKLLASSNSQKRSHDSKQNAKSFKAVEMVKAIMLLLVGIFMLILLAEPLVESVRKFSESVKIEPFYVSFILVPLATNARTAIAAIRAASQKSQETASLTFSEIYHKVFLNNVLGFSVLVSVIYFRGFTWHFSAEIIVVVFVCIIMGLLASFKSTFSYRTLLIAFPLYPLSMIVVYFVNDAFQFA